MKKDKFIKKDQGKLRYDLLPPEFIAGMARGAYSGQGQVPSK